MLIFYLSCKCHNKQAGLLCEDLFLFFFMNPGGGLGGWSGNVVLTSEE